MRVDQYSSSRNARPGFPTAEEIKRTTQPWTGEALAKQKVAERVVNNDIKAEKICHR
jgi:hypothetical protein